MIERTRYHDSCVQAIVRSAIELLNDRGDAMIKPIVSRRLQLAGKGSKTGLFETPEGLPDGFYVLRLTAVSITDDGNTAENISHRYFEKTSGSFSEIDYEQYAGRSQAGMEVTK